MAASLTEEQGLALVKRLAEDDGFRTLFEKDRTTALKAIGLSHDLVHSLAEKCVEPCQLADKETFASVLSDTGSEALKAAMSMEIPRISLSR
jgi:putative modified peptide